MWFYMMLELHAGLGQDPHVRLFPHLRWLENFMIYAFLRPAPEPLNPHPSHSEGAVTETR